MSAAARMDTPDATSFGPLIGAVARRVWGEPNKRLSKPGEMRWGNQGARIVYSKTGAFKDTEADQSGGTLELLRHTCGLDKGGAVAWLVREGLIPDRAREHAIKLHPGQRIVATFLFTDADGKLLYRKHRIEPGRGDRRKEFAYDRPDSAGGWRWGRGDDQVPYRLADLANAPKDAAIYMAEGEAKADRLASWGLIATSSKDWRAFDFSGYVKGRSVIILPDNDNTGTQLAEKVKTDVERAEGRPVIVHLPRLPDKGDVLNWDGDAAELAALVDTAPSATAAPADTFPVADLAAWAKVEPTAKRFVMTGVIPEGEVTLFTGPGGTNKSTFGLQLCACAAAGVPMLRVAVDAVPALYVTAEDEDRENHWRLRKIANAIGTTLEGLAGRLNVVSIRGRLNNELAVFDAEGRLHPAPAFQLLRATIEETGSKLIVLDNVGHLYVGNENDRGQVTAFINLLYQLCRELGVTIVLIAHPNKAGDSYSGSTAWLNAVRSQIVLQRPEDGLDPDARVLTLGKANYARPDQQLAFRWHDFALVVDADLSDDQRAEVASIARDANDNAVFLKCLAGRTRQQRAVSEKTGRNLAPVVFATMPEAKGVGKERLERAMDRLFRLGKIERAELWKGADRKPVYGLRERAGNAAGNGAETRCGNAGNPSAETRATHTPLLRKGTGAAFQGFAPVPEGNDDHTPNSVHRTVPGMILAPGETGFEPLPDDPFEGTD